MALQTQDVTRIIIDMFGAFGTGPDAVKARFLAQARRTEAMAAIAIDAASHGTEVATDWTHGRIAGAARLAAAAQSPETLPVTLGEVARDRAEATAESLRRLGGIAWQMQGDMLRLMLSDARAQDDAAENAPAAPKAAAAIVAAPRVEVAQDAQVAPAATDAPPPAPHAGVAQTAARQVPAAAARKDEPATTSGTEKPPAAAVVSKSPEVADAVPAPAEAPLAAPSAKAAPAAKAPEAPAAMPATAPAATGAPGDAAPSATPVLN